MYLLATLSCVRATSGLYLASYFTHVYRSHAFLAATRSYMFVLRRGVVNVSKDGVSRHYLSRGGFFGEICLVYPKQRRTTTLVAITPCELAALHRSDYQEVRGCC